MTDIRERHFSIDPGKGKKMDGCPYSTYEDGRDVKDYIIPPKGHVFKGFKFDPDARNQIYDGKLIAVYEKETFNERMKSNLWKVMLALFIIVVATVIILLTANVFNEPKHKPEPQPVVTAEDTTEQVQPVVEVNEITPPVDTNTTVQEEEVVVAPEVDEPVEEVTPLPADDPNVQFKNEFWTLIHQRTILMDPYDILFKDNRNKVEGEEYDYLRFVILKDSNAFKTWSNQLRNIPVSELESINSVNDLKKKLKETE